MIKQNLSIIIFMFDVFIILSPLVFFMGFGPMVLLYLFYFVYLPSLVLNVYQRILGKEKKVIKPRKYKKHLVIS